MNFFRKKNIDNGDFIKESPGSCECKDDCRHRKRHRHGKSLAAWEATGREESPLSESPAGSLCIVSHNSNKMTKEIGINPGKTIAVFKNEPADPNMIICLDTTRFIVAKSIARKITVRAIPADEQE